MKKYIKKIWELYKPFRKTVIVLFVLTLAIQILYLIPPIIYAKTVDSIFAKSSLSHSLILVSAIFIIEILSGFFDQIKTRLELKYLDYDIERYICNKNLDKILGLSMGQNTNENSGVKQSVLDRGTKAIEESTFYTMFEILPLFFKILLSVVAMLIISLVLGGIMLLGVILFIYFLFYIDNLFREDLNKVEEMHNDLGKEYTEILWNIPTIEINSQEESSRQRYDRKFSKICVLGKRVWIKYMNIRIPRDSIGKITEFVIMFLGVLFVFKGFYTPGMLIVFWSWSSRAFEGIGQFGHAQRQYMKWFASIKKYLDLLDIKPDIKEVKNPIKLEKLKGEIEFQNISFKYPYREHR